ncbi:MAG: hypothetical protein GY796_06030 [Chloroflexi bacterium]|nr:hypothetical protein [Chloroflexota bacterium]
MEFFVLEPEVAGGWGKNTEADTSVYPPRVFKLHYEFSGWLGDCIIESFPCFLVTADASQAISEAHLSGYEFVNVEVSQSNEFDEFHPGYELPTWRWLEPTGTPGKDDFAVTNKVVLVVSNRALNILKEHGLEHCNVSRYKD